MSSISAGTTTTTGYVVSSDTTGALVLKTGASATTAVTIGSDQSVTFVGSQTLSGGTANGVLYLNGSKVVTSGSALVFDGTNLGIGASTPLKPLDVSFASGARRFLVSYDDSVITIKGAGSTNAPEALRVIGDNIRFNTGITGSGSEVMRLDSSGNLGVGTSSPSQKLEVAGNMYINTSGNPYLQIKTSGAGNNPYIRMQADTNYWDIQSTFSNTNDDLLFQYNGTALLDLDKNGNLGLGVTPSAFGSNKAIQVGNSGFPAVIADIGGDAFFGSNAYNDGVWRYRGTYNASLLRQSVGTFAFFTAASGTAGNAITFTQAMTLDASGNLLVGTTSAGYSAASRGLVEINGTSSALLGLKTGNTNRGYLYTQGTDMIAWAETGAFTVGTAGAYQVSFTTNNTERARIDSSGKFLLGTTAGGGELSFKDATGVKIQFNADAANSYTISKLAGGGGLGDGEFKFTSGNTSAGAFTFSSGGSERVRIDSSGNLLVGKTVTTFSTAGSVRFNSGQIQATVNGDDIIAINRLTNDGNLIRFFQDGVEEGNISVSGSTISYNGGHLSRWAQTTAPKDDTLVKGTVLSNLDAMNVYTDAEGNPVDNEQLNKVKVSDTEGDANVAGVFVNWSHDEDHNVDEINMAMTGDMIIRIAQGTTVVRGDLLMSAGDGTAKPQGDDIVRSKTVAKVTSNHVTCTYADGSYCVPCVLMAC